MRRPAIGPFDAASMLMADKNYHTLPVIEDGRLVGIVVKEDVLRALLG